MYRGSGAGGFLTGSGEQIGSGWQPFTAVFGGGDFDGDDKPDILARAADGALLLYRGDAAGGSSRAERKPSAAAGGGWAA